MPWKPTVTVGVVDVPSRTANNGFRWIAVDSGACFALPCVFVVLVFLTKQKTRMRRVLFVLGNGRARHTSHRDHPPLGHGRPGAPVIVARVPMDSLGLGPSMSPNHIHSDGLVPCAAPSPMSSSGLGRRLFRTYRHLLFVIRGSTVGLFWGVRGRQFRSFPADVGGSGGSGPELKIYILNSCQTAATQTLGAKHRAGFQVSGPPNPINV
jgi:hypothetical protein